MRILVGRIRKGFHYCESRKMKHFTSRFNTELIQLFSMTLSCEKGTNHTIKNQRDYIFDFNLHRLINFFYCNINDLR